MKNVLTKQPAVDRTQLGQPRLFLAFGTEIPPATVSEELFHHLNDKGLFMDAMTALLPQAWGLLKRDLVGQVEIFGHGELDGTTIHCCKDYDTLLVGLKPFIPY